MKFKYEIPGGFAANIVHAMGLATGIVDGLSGTCSLPESLNHPREYDDCDIVLIDVLVISRARLHVGYVRMKLS